jgi:hypothetical protein
MGRDVAYFSFIAFISIADILKAEGKKVRAGSTE